MSPDETPMLQVQDSSQSSSAQPKNQSLKQSATQAAESFEAICPTNPQATELNSTISSNNPTAINLLSNHGRRAYFPKAGILAQGAEAKGLDINATIGVGLNDDGTPMALDSITKNFNIPTNQAIAYSPSYGQPELRDLWKQEIIAQNPSLPPNTIFSTPVIVSGLTNGLKVAADLFVNPGDQIIISDFYWENYNLIFEEASYGQIVNYPTFNDSNGYNIPAIAQQLDTPSSTKKILLLNFPNNPTGYTPTKTEADQLVQALLSAAESGKEIVVILDDAYFGLSFEDDIMHESMFSKLAALHPNIIITLVKGESKEGYGFGLRAAGITFSYKGMTLEAAAAFEHKAAGIVRGMESNCATASQFAIINSRKSPTYRQEKETNFKTLESRYQKTKEILSDPKFSQYFTSMPFNSGYFMCIKPQVDTEKLRQALIHEHSTGTINIDNRLIRIAFSSAPSEKLPIIFENIYQACVNLTQKSN